MLTAWAFLCAISASDCEHSASIRAIVGQGLTPIGCLMDGEMGAANNDALRPGEGERVVIACRHRRAPG